jgi:hypothetical protein
MAPATPTTFPFSILWLGTAQHPLARVAPGSLQAHIFALLALRLRFGTYIRGFRWILYRVFPLFSLIFFLRVKPPMMGPRAAPMEVS